MAKDKEFFHLINRAYRRAGKTWDTAEPDTMRGALGYCDVKKGVAWVDSNLYARPLNHVLLHELAHLVRESKEDYDSNLGYCMDEIIVEQATRVVLSLKDYLSVSENLEFMDRIKWYGERVEVIKPPHLKHYRALIFLEMATLIDDLEKLMEEEQSLEDLLNSWIEEGPEHDDKYWDELLKLMKE